MAASVITAGYINAKADPTLYQPNYSVLRLASILKLKLPQASRSSLCCHGWQIYSPQHIHRHLSSPSPIIRLSPSSASKYLQMVRILIWFASKPPILMTTSSMTVSSSTIPDVRVFWTFHYATDTKSEEGIWRKRTLRRVDVADQHNRSSERELLFLSLHRWTSAAEFAL